MQFKLFVLTMFLLMTLLCPVRCFSQSPAPPTPGVRPNLGVQDDRENEARTKMERNMAKKANHDRQEQLQRDTDNLLKLATELKQYVDKSNENTLSLDVIKKAEEIEKLAHSVKEKMKAN